jgi:hypothetical protein
MKRVVVGRDRWLAGAMGRTVRPSTTALASDDPLCVPRLTGTRVVEESQTMVISIERAVPLCWYAAPRRWCNVTMVTVTT